MNAVTKDFATESGHWYDRDGNPRYTIVGANGKERGTTVKDARKHGYLPSVTTILRQAAAPGLERWKIANAISSALSLALQEGESEESYLFRIVQDSEEKARKARELGTTIHGAIEKLDRHGPYAAHVDAAMGAVGEWAGLTDWDPERSFASPLGFGGKLDLSTRGYVVDFKSTDKPLGGPSRAASVAPAHLLRGYLEGGVGLLISKRRLQRLQAQRHDPLRGSRRRRRDLLFGPVIVGAEARYLWVSPTFTIPTGTTEVKLNGVTLTANLGWRF